MNWGFERPLMAILALVLVPVVIYASRFFRNPFTVSVPLGAPGGIPFKSPLKIEWLIKLLRFLEYTGLVLLFFGAAGPYLIVNRTVNLNRGAEIIFVIDVSPSMSALDMNGISRFSAARSLLKDFAERRPADSIGLVAFGSEAILLLPPLADRELLFERLDKLRIAELGDGTALGDGLAIAAYHLDKTGNIITRNGSASRRAVILITDGENNAGSIHPETAAGLLGRMGVSLWIIGIGTTGIVPVDYNDPVTGIRRTGLFDSRFDEEAMRRISEAGNGSWLKAPTAQALNAAFAHIDDQEMIVRRTGNRTSCRPYHIPVLLTALCLLTGVRFIRRFFLGAMV